MFSVLELLDPTFRYAVEFRHLSWIRDETWDLLEEYKVVYVNVDEPLLASEVHLTADFSYFRWYGRGKQSWFDYRYSEEELEEIVPKVEETSGKVKKVLGYFDNHFHGYAPEKCLHLLEGLNLLTEQQTRAKGRLSQKQSGLDRFFRQ